MPAQTKPNQVAPEDRASILFMTLDIAQARGEYTKAAALQDLGWVVRRCRPRSGNSSPTRKAS